MKKQKKRFDLKKKYLESFSYLKESKNFIWAIVAVFFVFSLIGFFLPVPQTIELQILEMIKQLVEKTANMSALGLIQFIFLNNLQSSFLGLFLGVLFGIFPLIVSLSNGYLLGFVASKSVGLEGILSLWKIFPHGIFELPAVFIALGMGMKLGTFIFQEKKADSFKRFFSESFQAFVLIVLPLLFIAAIIEGFLISYL